MGWTAAVIACVALLAPAPAGAATVVNGDFEAGSLQGWRVQRATEAGNWFAYKGTNERIAKQRGVKPPQEPPQGKFAAIADQVQPDSLILAQDVALGAGLNHRLSLLVYYDSYAPLAVPSPDTLAVGDEVLGGQANQQFRVDVLRAGAPLDSVAPSDVLATAFRTAPGGPASLGPTWVTANLAAFAGQAVTLRVANAAHQELFTAGVDAVAVDSAPPGKPLPPLGSSRFSFGKVKLNRSNGTAVLSVKVPGPGQLTAKGKGIKRASAKAPKAGTAKLRLKPTASGLATLRDKHKLRVKVAVTFAPAGGKPKTATLPVTLKLVPKHRR